MELIDKCYEALFWVVLVALAVCVVVALVYIFRSKLTVDRIIGINLIGTMKALGADNRFVRRIFLTQAAMLIGKGVLWGNIVGLGLAALQYFCHLIPLDATTYYVEYVPIAFAWGWLILLNIVTIAISLSILLLPSMIITKISPAKVMHFE